ncbi:Hypothetical protein HVR_LOCUS402 [uncultured virus]|nr:Hypothetical protein HVR_LOCUS402 [uncultured virus]
MSIAIHEPVSRITYFNMDRIEVATQLPSNLITSTPRGVPINNNTFLYTILPDNNPIIDASHLGKLFKPHWVYNIDEALSSTSNDNIVIVKQYIKRDGNIGFCYAVYPISHIPYYVLSHSEDKRTFFEYLRGPRKPYFDNELERESGITQRDINQFNQCIRLLLESINNNLLANNVKYNPDTNLIIWCSHSNTKLSIHIIIDRLYHIDAFEAKVFYNLCISSIPQDIITYFDDNNKRHIIVDGSVYNNRPFRFPWCTKIGKNRPLIPDPIFKSNYIPGPLDANDILAANPDKRTTLLTQWLFHHSMICYLADCEPLPSFKTTTTMKKNIKPIGDNIDSLYLDCYNNEPELVNNYTIREDLSSNYLYLQRKGVVKCINNEHGVHKSNNSMITLDTYINAIVFRCFAHNGYKILRRLDDIPNPDENKIDEDCGLYIGGFNLTTNEYNEEKALEASFQRNATPNDVIFFINSLERMPNCNINSKTLRDKFKQYCDNNRLEPWFKQKQLDDLLLATNEIDTSVAKDGTVFIIGYSTDNISTIVRPDLPEKFVKQQATQQIMHINNVPQRRQATIHTINNGIIPQPINDNINNNITPPIVYVKRPATLDDVKYFIDSLRVDDTTQSATCPQLYAEFNKYCERSELYTSVGSKQFSNYISKYNNISCIINKRGCRIINNISLNLGSNVTRKDNIKFEAQKDIRCTLALGNPNNNHLLNNNCKINNDYIHDTPINNLVITNPEIPNKNASATADANVIKSHEIPIEFSEEMIRDFWDAEMIEDVNNKINIVSVNKSFQMWCKENNVYFHLKTKGLSRLLTKRLSLRREKSHGISYIVGWNVKRMISKEEHDKKEDALERIFNCWPDRYEIGRHNGPYPYYHMGTSHWRNTRVIHDYVYTKGTNGRILLPGLENIVATPGNYTDNINDNFILFLKADMGSGKSEAIKRYIESKPDMRVIYVVPIITLANKILSDLVELGFKIYSDESLINGGIIEGNRICTTYNSLHKIIMPTDLIVFDEYRMIQKMQFSPILKKKLESYRALCYRLKETPRVIIADALLENKHVMQVKDITNRPTIVYQCMNKLHEGKEVVVVDNEFHAINSIIASADRGLRIAVASGSAKCARFLRNNILKLNPDLNVGLYTQEETKDITVDVTTLWDQHTIIIYTPTILAGSSYLGQVDVVYGIFLTDTVGPDGAVQMLFRCRTAQQFHICVKDTHMKKKRMPDDIYPSYSNSLNWLDDRNRLYRTAGGEDNIYVGLNYGTGELDQNYLRLYASYIQDEEKARRNYRFYLLLYMRDMGLRFGGLVTAISNEDKEAVNVTRAEYQEYSKGTNNKYWNEVENVKPISSEDNKVLSVKSNKTREEQQQIIKYKIMTRYGVPNEAVTAKVARIARGKDLKHDNIRACEKLSGVPDDKIQEEMRKVYTENLPKHLRKLLPIKTKEIRPLTEIMSGLIDGNPTISDIEKEYRYLNETDYMENMKCCFHAIMLLRLFGLKDFMTIYMSNNNAQVDSRVIIPYIDINWEEIRIITRLKEEKSKIYWNDAVRILLDRAFGISYISHKGYTNNPYINSGVFTKVHGKIVLTAMDPTHILTTAEIFTNNVVNRINQQPKALTLSVIKT